MDSEAPNSPRVHHRLDGRVARQAAAEFNAVLAAQLQPGDGVGGARRAGPQGRPDAEPQLHPASLHDPGAGALPMLARRLLLRVLDSPA